MYVLGSLSAAKYISQLKARAPTGAHSTSSLAASALRALADKETVSSNEAKRLPNVAVVFHRRWTEFSGCGGGRAAPHYPTSPLNPSMYTFRRDYGGGQLDHHTVVVPAS